MANTGGGRNAGSMVLALDAFDLEAFLAAARAYGTDGYGYVVTPNVDHIIRLQESVSFRALYAGARFVLLDSRIAARAIRLVHGIDVPVCPGSDITAALFGRVIARDDRIVVIGGTEAQAEALRARYGLTRLLHHNPPWGFMDQPEAVERCLQFIEAASPFRYCLLAVGSPRQEMVAQRLAERGKARGLALCIGASIDFLTGAERRAPAWVQRAHLEWLFRLLQSPRRLAGRYLLRGPRFFLLVRQIRFELRKRCA